MKLYIFRTVRLVIISSLFTVHSAMVYVIHVCRELSSRTWSCSKAVYKHVWHIPLLIVQWINSSWWTEKLSETFRFSWQNKFVKLIHLVGFIIKIVVHVIMYTVKRLCKKICSKKLCTASKLSFLIYIYFTHTHKDIYLYISACILCT